MSVTHRFRGIVAAGLLLFIVASAPAKYSGGTGEPNDPYQIATAADLIALGETPADYDKHFILTADIDLDPNLPGRRAFAGAVIGGPLAQAELPALEMEGYQGTPFTGVLDGNDHEVRNLMIEVPWDSTPGAQGSYVGLIAQIGEKGQVKRLGLPNVSINGSGADFVGGLAGENRGTILSCYSSGRVTTFGLVGGLVGGQYMGTITSCHSDGSVKGVRVGGLVGLLWTGTVSSCHSTASVEKYHQISDMIGYFEYAGGLVGRNWAATISSCYASGEVTADVLAGGLVGTNDEGVIHACYASGKVAGELHAGGLVGSNGGNIVSCYATGDVSGRWHVGGLAGRAADGSVATSYSVGKVTGGYSAGGLVGGDSSTSAYLSYWDMETSGLTNSTAGEGRTTAQMMSLATFAGWGHDARWVLEEGRDYPRLVWEGRPGLLLTEPPRTYSGGSGDPNAPYLVKTPDDLICLGESPGDWGASFALVSDIDLTSIPPAGLLRIGTLALPFTGTFDGRGHTVRGLRIEATPGSYSSVVGLFGRIGPSGAVRHVHLAEIVIAGEDCVGGLVGSNEGYVLACSVTGDVSASGTVGGVAGENGGTVVSSCATCSVRGSRLVGGLVGGNHGVISSCYATGTVEGSDYVGGLAGWNSGGVAKCYSAGVGQGGRYIVGGLVGRNDPDHGTVADCFWDMNTWGPTWDDLGIGRTTTEMQTAKTFLDAGWDFIDETANGTEDIWWIEEGKDYPRLWWERTARYGGGTGEPNDPYQIATAADLITLGETPEDYDKHFILTADIDLDPNLPGRRVFDKAVIAPDTQTEGYEFQGPAFTGSFNGNDHTISHLTIEGGDYDYVGLFGELTPEARVKALHVADVNITGRDHVGGLVGHNYGSIMTSHSTGIVKGGAEVGGLAGSNEGTITTSYSSATVSETPGPFPTFFGGFVGYNHLGCISMCYSTGTVTGHWPAGGLAGGNWLGSIVASYSTAAVRGTGLAVGGLVGDSMGGSIVMCYSTGTVTGGTMLGGLVGSRTSSSKITSSFWDSETSGRSWSDGGTGKTTAEMHDINTFLREGWDFVDEAVNGTCDYWRMVPGNYPRLRYLMGEEPVMPEGQGTAEQPYLIRDARDFGTVWFEPLAYYRLEASPDLSEITWSMAVVPWFAGTFDGNACAIRGLHMHGVGNLGLFGMLDSEAKVLNLGLEAVQIDGTGDDVGALAARNEGSIAMCHSTGSIAGDGSVGGLLGSNTGDVTTSYSTGAVGGNSSIGGLAGWSDGSIMASYSTGPVKGKRDVGGLVGANSGTISSSSNSGSVSGTLYVGGLAGVNSGTISSSSNSGSVSGTSYVGGLAGFTGDGSIVASHNSGSVSGSGRSVGGLAGVNSGSIMASYSTGPVEGKEDVGGLVGSNWTDVAGYYHVDKGTIANSYSSGLVTGTDRVGGLVGNNDESGEITSCFWDSQTSGQTTSAGGTGKTTAEMQMAKTFLDAGWDFVDETANGTEDIWWIDEGKDYPRLWWEVAEE